MDLGKNYLEELKKRGAKSRISRKHQLLGLEIAKMLGDEKHKSLYMKLLKEGNSARLMWLAAEVADRKKIQNKGAYFMKLLPQESILGLKLKKKRQGKLKLKRKNK